MTEQMRKEFEAWCASNSYTLRPAETNCGIVIEGQYGNQRVQIAWEAWQASRAALCVTLPDIGFNSEDDPWCVQDVIESAVKDALDAAGVRYE